MKEERKMYYLMKFEELVDCFDENDPLCIEDTYLEMHKHLKSYIDAGCNLEDLLKMTSPVDVFNNYESLVSSGAKIDLIQLADGIHVYLFETPDESNEFFKENYSWFLSHGLLAKDLFNYFSDGYDRQEFIYDHIDEIKGHVDRKTLSDAIIKCYEDCGEIFCEDVYEEYTKAGLDPIPLAEFAAKCDWDYCDYLEDEQWVGFLDNLYEAGAPKDLCKELLDRLDCCFYRDLFIDNKVEWLKKFDDNLDEYIDKAVFRLWDDQDYHTVAEMPEEVRALVSKKLFDKVPIHDLDLELLEGYDGVENFFKETGLDIDFLVDKFLKEDGYTNCCDDWLMFELYLLAPDKIDLEKLVKKILETAEKYGKDDIEGDYNRLKEAGADEKIIAPLLKTN